MDLFGIIANGNETLEVALLGTGTMDGLGQFSWTGGDVAGTLKLEDGIQTYMEGLSTKDLDGTVTNLGRFVFRASDPTKPPTGQLRFGSQAKFNNSGVFIADERTGMVGTFCCALRSLSSEGPIDIRGGTLAGTGTVTGNLYNYDGTISPGNPAQAGSTGVLNVAGNYRQGPQGTLKVNLKGSTPGSGFDQLRVTQQAVLDGTLDLDRASTYTPGLTTKLKVLTMASRLGKFNQLQDTALPNGREWYAVCGSSDVRLGVVKG